MEIFRRSLAITLTVLLAIMSISATAIASFVAAADEETVSFLGMAAPQVEFTIEQSLNGKDVTHIIRIPEKTEISALQLDVSYDVSVLKYQGVKTHSLYESGLGQINDKERGKITCAFVSLTPLTDGGAFIEFSFTSLGQAQISSEMISFAFTELANSNGKTINHHVRYIGFYEPPADQTESDAPASQPSQSETEDIVGSESDKESETPVSQPSQSETEDIVESESNKEIDNDDISNEDATESDGVSDDENIPTIGSGVSGESGNDSPQKEQSETNIFNEETQQKDPTEKEESLKNFDAEAEKQEEPKHDFVLWIALGVLFFLIFAAVSIYFIKHTKEKTK